MVLNMRQTDVTVWHTSIEYKKIRFLPCTGLQRTLKVTCFITWTMSVINSYVFIKVFRIVHSHDYLHIYICEFNFNTDANVLIKLMWHVWNLQNHFTHRVLLVWGKNWGVYIIIKWIMTLLGFTRITNTLISFRGLM